jgi:hypothetical protein
LLTPGTVASMLFSALPQFARTALPAYKYGKLLVDARYMLIYQIKGAIVYIDYMVDCRQDYSWLI